MSWGSSRIVARPDGQRFFRPRFLGVVPKPIFFASLLRWADTISVVRSRRSVSSAMSAPLAGCCHPTPHCRSIELLSSPLVSKLGWWCRRCGPRCHDASPAHLYFGDSAIGVPCPREVGGVPSRIPSGVGEPGAQSLHRRVAEVFWFVALSPAAGLDQVSPTKFLARSSERPLPSRFSIWPCVLNKPLRLLRGRFERG